MDCQHFELPAIVCLNLETATLSGSVVIAAAQILSGSPFLAGVGFDWGRH